MLKKEIQEEEERLKVKKIHIDMDLKHVQEESDYLEKTLSKQTGTLDIKLEELKNQKEDVQSRIKQLIIELEQKRNLEASTIDKIEDLTTKV